MTKDTGGSAFPVSTIDGLTVYGTTLRQWYAGMALQGLCAHPEGSNGSFHTNCGEQFTGMAEYAFKLADAMIAQNEAALAGGKEG